MISSEVTQPVLGDEGRGSVPTGLVSEQIPQQEIQARKDEITVILKKVFEKKFSQHQHLTDQEKENLTSSFVNALSSDDQSKSIDRFVSTYQKIYSSFSPIQLKYSIARRDLLSLFYQLRQYINKGTPIKRGEGDQMRVIALSELLTPAELLTPKPDGPLPNRTEQEERLELESSLSEFQTNSEKGAKSYETYLDLVFSEQQTKKKSKRKETAPASNLDLLNLEDLQLFHHKLFYIDLYKKLLVKLEQYRNTRFPSIRQLIDQKSEQINAELRRYKNELIGLTIFPALRVSLGLFYPETKKMDVEELLPKFYLMLDQMNSLEGFKKVQDHIRIAINTDKLLGGKSVNGVFIDNLVSYLMSQVEEKSALEAFGEATIGKVAGIFAAMRDTLSGNIDTKKKQHEVYENLKSQMPFLITELGITYKALNLEGTGLADYESLHPLQQKKAMRMALSHPKLNDILVNDWDGFVQRYEEFSANTQGVNEEVNDVEGSQVEEVSDEGETKPEEPVVSELSQFLLGLNPEVLMNKVTFEDNSEFTLPNIKQAEAIAGHFAQVAELVKQQIALEIFMHRNHKPVRRFRIFAGKQVNKVPDYQVELDVNPVNEKVEYGLVIELTFSEIKSALDELQAEIKKLAEAIAAITTYLNDSKLKNRKGILKALIDTYSAARSATEDKLLLITKRYNFSSELLQYLVLPSELSNASTLGDITDANSKISTLSYRVGEVIKAVQVEKEKAKQVYPTEVVQALSLERIGEQINGIVEDPYYENLDETVYIKDGVFAESEDSEYLVFRALAQLLKKDANNALLGNEEIISLIQKLDIYLKKPETKQILLEVDLYSDIVEVLEMILNLPNSQDNNVAKCILDVFRATQDNDNSNELVVQRYSGLVKDILEKIRPNGVLFENWFKVEYLFEKGGWGSKASTFIDTLESVENHIRGYKQKYRGGTEVMGLKDQDQLRRKILIQGLQSALGKYGVSQQLTLSLVTIENMPSFTSFKPKSLFSPQQYGFYIGSFFVNLHQNNVTAQSIYNDLAENFREIKRIDREALLLDELLEIISVLKTIRLKGKGEKSETEKKKAGLDFGDSNLSTEQRQSLIDYLRAEKSAQESSDGLTQKKVIPQKGKISPVSNTGSNRITYHEFYTPERRNLLVDLFTADENLRALLLTMAKEQLQNLQLSSVQPNSSSDIADYDLLPYLENEGNLQLVVDALATLILEDLILNNQEKAKKEQEIVAKKLQKRKIEEELKKLEF